MGAGSYQSKAASYIQTEDAFEGQSTDAGEDRTEDTT